MLGLWHRADLSIPRCSGEKYLLYPGRYLMDN